MADTNVRHSTPDDAAVVGRLLFDLNTEFETETASPRASIGDVTLAVARSSSLRLGRHWRPSAGKTSVRQPHNHF
jgi:hypothetical protein